MGLALALIAALLVAAPAQAAPPPADVTTPAKTVRMAQSSYCWKTDDSQQCVDYVEPGARDDLPRVRLARGDRVRFRLRFDPSEVALILPHRTIELAAKRRPRWRVTGRPEWLILFAKPHGWGDASYAISVRMAP